GCGGGTIIAVAGSSSINLASATLTSAPPTACVFTVNVTGTTAGTKNNMTGAVTSVEGGTGGMASASLIVTGIPTPSAVVGGYLITNLGGIPTPIAPPGYFAVDRINNHGHAIGNVFSRLGRTSSLGPTDGWKYNGTAWSALVSPSGNAPVVADINDN